MRKKREIQHYKIIYDATMEEEGYVRVLLEKYYGSINVHYGEK